MTQLESARQGIVTDLMRQAAAAEGIDPEILRQRMAEGTAIICHNVKREKGLPLAVGKGMRTKVNANIGTSPLNCNMEMELDKLRNAIKYGADAVMDLSTGGDIDLMRRKVLENSEAPVGTVPIYQVVEGKKNVNDVGPQDFIDSIEKHVEDGVDFITVHCGITKECIPLVRERKMGVVSRGGSIIIRWMLHHQEENPLFTYYDKVLKIAKKHDVTLSLGDGLRPGCLADATDRAQLTELRTLGELTMMAQNKGVQVMVEGPGHVPLDQIKKNVELQKEYCNGAPFYVLGPLVTDISPGYDHITGAIGGALAAYYGADFLCYLTPMEHLGLPNSKDVVDGVIASKIAAHAADIARGIRGARDIDDGISDARRELDWEEVHRLSMNPQRARQLRGEVDTDVCSMCGDFCSMRLNKEFREMDR